MNEAVRIRINRVEGPQQKIDLRREPGVDIWRTADAMLSAWSLTAPKKGGGYDKCDFVITWEDGEEYVGRFDLQYGLPDGGLACQVDGFLRFYSRERCPAWISTEQYLQLVEDAGMADDCRRFLEEHKIGNLGAARNTEGDIAVCPECGYEYVAEDGQGIEDERTSIEDHGRCWSCQKKWQHGELDWQKEEE